MDNSWNVTGAWILGANVNVMHNAGGMAYTEARTCCLLKATLIPPYAQDTTPMSLWVNGAEPEKDRLVLMTEPGAGAVLVVYQPDCEQNLAEEALLVVRRAAKDAGLWPEGRVSIAAREADA